MGIFIRRIVSFIVTAGGWMLAGVRTVLDAIGYSTTPDDVGVAMTRLDQFLIWLLALPWWVPWGFAMISTLSLMWISWPRQAPRTQQAIHARLDERVLPAASEGAIVPVNVPSIFQRTREQVIDDLESHNTELQAERDGLRKQVENQRAGTDALVNDIRLGRADDVTSRYWLSFEAAHFLERLDVCLDLQVLTWTSGRDPTGFSWSRKTRHVVRSCSDVVGGRTFSIQVVEDRPSMFEANAPHWFVGDNSADGTGWISTPTSFQRAAFVFIADRKEQTHKFIALPRFPDEALCIIDELFFDTATFWDTNQRHLTLRLARGIRERTTPEARNLP